MTTRKLFGCLVALSLCLTQGSAEERALVSSVATLNNPADTWFIFDFPTPEGADINVTRVGLDWTVTLPTDATFAVEGPVPGELVLNGDLALDTTPGGVGFTLTMPSTGGTSTVSVSKSGGDQAVQQIVTDLYEDGNNVVTARLNSSADFETFFGAVGPNGEIPTVQARMTLYYDGDGRGEGNEPEPASILIVGTLAGGMLLRRRMTQSK